ncbi:HlyD family efflux transporter periplasmic adaptor subunit [Schlesneria paludicola]|uniref:HlyD family efflux transporter periplasmic adaptor subunit n=1 Tax=Schlesneria paludicola TaxID=360056 RepID=UPI000492D659|nr:HlyD family efflux transporter periplasmic adaptor subunit [Schlesneria paludicola]
MRAELPHSPKSDTRPPQLQMERMIDHLAELARTNGDPGAFFAEILRTAIEAGGARNARLWTQSIDSGWQLAGEMPTGTARDEASIVKRQTLLTEVSKEERPRRVNFVAGPPASASGHPPAESTHVLVPIRHANQSVGVLETELGPLGPGELPAETVQFFAMLCEIAADFLALQELQQLRRSRAVWLKWDQFAHRLSQSLDLNSVCATIANDGRLLAESDRVSVLIRHGNSYRLAAVSGVERIEPRSSATRDLESMARWAAHFRKPIWHRSSSDGSGNRSDAAADESLQRYLRNSGGTEVGFVPVAVDFDGIDCPSPVAMIVFDQFQSTRPSAGSRSQSELMVNRGSSALRAAIERSEIPWLAQWQRLKRWPGAVFRVSTLIIAVLVAGLTAGLVLIPVDFTVEGSADLWPAQRREVFASSTGIVDQILVGHGADVIQGQPLIVLRDPALESDTPRINGEIATVSERLKGVQAARLSGGTTPDVVGRSRQLTADEEELKERLRTLERQRLLVEKRVEALTLRSPIAGKVLTWDVEQHLSARPVERGQSLLMIGDTSGPWIVEARVADKNVGHLLRARQEQSSDLPVDFMLAAEPGKTYHGHVQEMSLSSEYDDTSRGHVRLVIAVDTGQAEQLRSGATVFPRIHCGRKSLGYVWLRDLIDAVRTRILF